MCVERTFYLAAVVLLVASPLAAMKNERCATVSDVTQVKILGLFELSGDESYWGWMNYAASLLAIDDMNKFAEQEGYNFRFSMKTNDTKCNVGQSIGALFNALNANAQEQSFAGLVGPTCPDPTVQLAAIAAHFRLAFISSSVADYVLNDKKRFPTFFRTIASEIRYNDARIHMIRHHGWRHVCLLSEDYRSISFAFDQLGGDLAEWNISVLSIRSFSTADDLDNSLNEFKAKGCRIFVASCTTSVVSPLLCEAVKHGLASSRHVWILREHNEQHRGKFHHTISSTCSQRTLNRARNGTFSIASYTEILAGYRSSSGYGIKSRNTFKEGFFDKLHSVIDTNRHRADPSVIERLENISNVPYQVRDQYDALWTLFWAVSRKAEKCENLVLDLADEIRDLDFPGISGQVSFEGSDCRVTPGIYQWRNGKSKLVGYFERQTGTLVTNCTSCNAILWQDGRVPQSSSAIEIVDFSVSLLATAVICVCVTIGLAFSAFVAAFNLFYKNVKYVKLSSPNLNILIITGCALVYFGVFLMPVEPHSYEYGYLLACTTRTFLFAAGFSMSFGCLFARTYRVHFIFTHKRRNGGFALRSKLLQDKPIFAGVTFLVAIDAIIVVCWTLADPQHKNVKQLSAIEVPEEDKFLVPQISYCSSRFYEIWYTLLCAYKGLLLVLGAYLAWEIRKIKTVALNDSQYIVACIYCISLTSALSLVVVVFVRDQPTLQFVLSSMFILLAPTSTLCLLFVPKIFVLLKGKGDDAVYAGTLFKTSGRTMRLNLKSEEFRDALLRAEIQNRVFKQQFIALEEEIDRLILSITFANNQHSGEEYENRDDLPVILVNAPKRTLTQRLSVFATEGVHNRKVSRLEGSDFESDHLLPPTHTRAAPPAQALTYGRNRRRSSVAALPEHPPVRRRQSNTTGGGGRAATILSKKALEFVLQILPESRVDGSPQQIRANRLRIPQNERLLDESMRCRRPVASLNMPAVHRPPSALRNNSADPRHRPAPPAGVTAVIAEDREQRVSSPKRVRFEV